MASGQISAEILKRLDDRAKEAEELIVNLEKQIAELKAMQYSQTEAKKLREENEQLKKDIELWRNKLIEAECRNGILQVPIPGEITRVSNGIHGEKELKKGPSDVQPLKQMASPVVKENSPVSSEAKPAEKKGKAKEKKKVETSKPEPKQEAPVDVSLLDLRVGCIVTAKKHPDADSLYVEEVDVGEDKPRTVVSGLVKFVPVEEMQNRMAVLLCNLKPAKMRGVLSEAMVMCASTPEKVEVLIPPAGSVPGDRVICEAFPGEPAKELNPKKKIFEQVAPDLKTSDCLNATYKGRELIVPGKGVIKAPSLANVNIK